MVLGHVNCVCKNDTGCLRPPHHKTILHYIGNLLRADHSLMSAPVGPTYLYHAIYYMIYRTRYQYHIIAASQQAELSAMLEGPIMCR